MTHTAPEAPVDVADGSARHSAGVGGHSHNAWGTEPRAVDLHDGDTRSPGTTPPFHLHILHQPQWSTGDKTEAGALVQSAEAKGHQPAWLISLSDLNGVTSKVSQAYYKHSDPRILGREWEPRRMRGYQAHPSSASSISTWCPPQNP